MDMKRPVLIASLAILLVGITWLVMEILLSSEYHRGRNDVIDHIRNEQKVCAQVNRNLQTYRVAMDCSVYADILEDID